MQMIEGVAVVDQHGRIWKLPRPFRHANVVHLMQGSGSRSVKQGFYTTSINFIGRVDAFILAKRNGQLDRRPGPQYYQGMELFSEDLW